MVFISPRRATTSLQVSLRELECDFLAGELLVHVGEGVGLVFDVGLLGLVQVDLEQAGTIQTDPDSLANNLSWVDKVIQDVVVDSLQSSGSWSLLLQLVCLPCRLGKNSPLGNEDHMLAAELLLELSNQPKIKL